ncbi:hypothetical protein HK096_009746, partial [Nowakowskiella sp. JEL0078]
MLSRYLLIDITINNLSLTQLSLQHHLRREYGVDYPDLADLLPNVPRVAGLGIVGNGMPMPLPNTAAPRPVTSESQPLIKPVLQRLDSFVVASGPKVSLPNILAGHLSSYVRVAKKNGKIANEDAQGLISNIEKLSTTFSTLELNGNTPVPLAYSVHISQTLNLYCAFLPFQLVDNYGWITLP